MTWLSELIGAVSFRPKRKIGNFTATITIEESATDDLEITQHPVQDGAAITDHAYMQPAKLNIHAQWQDTSDTPLDELYTKLRDLQASKVPMDVVTGKRIYKNMLIKTLAETTNKDTNGLLNITATLQQIIITAVTVVTVPARAKQREPSRTQATEIAGEKKVEPVTSASKKSTFETIFVG